MERLIAQVTLPAYHLYWRLWRPKSTRVRIVLVHGDYVLLVKNINKSYWNIISGMVEKGETLHDALFRELREELGIKVATVIKRLGTYKQMTRTRRDTVYVFVVSVPQKIPLKLQWEIDDARWFSLQALPLSFERGARQRLREFASGKEDIYSIW